jgi:hypothetical protein
MVGFIIYDKVKKQRAVEPTSNNYTPIFEYYVQAFNYIQNRFWGSNRFVVVEV